ncbi:MAG: T9SS type A sorting domain-containing protein [Bacteroidetes bacterium]|nr:T9SS type A sorting domain-containing protein [Bacteroidota bacterium]
MKRSIPIAVIVPTLMLVYIALVDTARAQLSQYEYVTAFMQNQGGSEHENDFELRIAAPAGTTVRLSQRALSITFDTTVPAEGLLSLRLVSGDLSMGQPSVECSDIPAPQSGMAVEITTDQRAEVIAYEHKLWSTDSWEVLPREVLGTNYYVMSYKPSIYPGGNSTPGEFAVIGLADSSHITVTLPTDSKALPKGSTTLPINAGDVLIVQSKVDDSTSDLTGSKISSDRPVAVLAGHVRTAIPSYAKNFGSQTGSRDFLCEQMLPVSYWQPTAIATRTSSSTLPDLVRIISGVDGNTIKVDGITVGIFNAGQFYEIPKLDSYAVIKGSGPLLAVQFMHSSLDGNNNNGTPYGDPSMIVCPPLGYFFHEQHLIAESNTAYTSQFVSIVASDTDISKLTFDGHPIPATDERSVEGSGYTVADIPVTQGDHLIGSDAVKYSARVYGFGPIDSYGYALQAYHTLEESVPEEHTISSEDLILQDPVPNPSGGADRTICVRYTCTTQGSLQWQLVDGLGRVICSGSVQATGGNGVIDVANSSLLANGTYTVLVRSQTTTCTKQIVVAK